MHFFYFYLFILRVMLTLFAANVQYIRASGLLTKVACPVRHCHIDTGGDTEMRKGLLRSMYSLDYYTPPPF